MNYFKVLLCLYLIRFSFGWWPFSEENEQETFEKDDLKINNNNNNNDNRQSSSMVPFETISVEQKFLQEAKELLDLSPLDQCQHRVISALKKSCSEINEEDLAKLSIHLLNCQSQNEERETYKCTKDMSVAECTKPMDPHMWNTYHIISNRARSVCYATRQQQFRLQTEAAVNQLSSATLQQLKAMDALAQANLQIRQATNESLEELKREQLGLLERQSLLSSSQNNLKDSIKDNIDQLKEERNIMKERQKEMENITRNIQKQLEVAREMLLEQERKRQESHDKTSHELDKLSHNILQIWNKIDTNTNELLQQFSQISSQYQNTLDNLQVLNDTVSGILYAVRHMNSQFNYQLSWLLDNIGGAQDGLRNLTLLMSHGFYLVFGCLVLVFIGVPWVSRFSLLLLVLLNVLLEFKFSAGFTLTQLTGCIFTIIIGDIILNYYKSFLLIISQYKRVTPSSLPPPPLSPPPPPRIQTPANNKSRIIPNNNNVITTTEEVSDSEMEDLIKDIEDKDGYIPIFPPPSTPILPTASTLSPHHRDMPTGIHSNRRCASITKSGLPCRLKPHPPSSQYCLRHKRL